MLAPGESQDVDKESFRVVVYLNDIFRVCMNIIKMSDAGPTYIIRDS